MLRDRHNPLYPLARALDQVENDNMPDRENSSREFREAYATADKKVYTIGSDAAVDFWENEAFDVICEARIDGFEKGFLTAAALAMVSAARTRQITEEYYESCAAAPVILPLIALATQGGAANA